MPRDPFNTDFYVIAATVIPVFYLALTLQGSTLKRLLERGIDESYKVLMLELNKGNGSWLQRQGEMWSRAILVNGFMVANMVALFSVCFGEPVAIVALYHRSVSPTSGELVLIITLGLVAVVAASQIFIIVTGPTLTKRLKEVAEEKSAEAQANRDAGSGRSGRDAEFLGLGVVVRDGEVLVQSTTAVRALGLLSGAQAGIAEPVAFRKRARVSVRADRGSRPFAYVVFPDGTLQQRVLKDKRMAAHAQADALRFNALAAAKHSGRLPPKM